MPIEKIYVGGLNPPHLTGQDIVPRLKSLDIKVLSIIVKNDKPFLHLTATSNGSKSALEIISKKYNNVKWKGCRLSVAAARPHFLERLETERRELTKQRQEGAKNEEEGLQKEETTSTPSDEENEQQPVNRIPRRLRVRKKYGDEAFHVDTKAWPVDNWSNFNRATGKLRKRAERHIHKAKEIKDPSFKSTPFMHRAVHIRFDLGAKTEVRHSKGKSDNDYEMSSSTDEDSLSTTGSDSSSDKSSVSLIRNSDQKNKNGAYAWSDDEDSDNESLKSEETSASAPPPEEESNRFPKDDALTAGKNKELEVNKKQVPKKGGYAWSSESSSDESSVQISRNQLFRDVTTTDEFAAGLDIASDKEESDSGSNDETDHSEQAATNETPFDMDNDVSANLNILSALFPDMTETSPATIQDSDKANTRLVKGSSSLKLNFSPGGIMPRYDPNDLSTQKYVMEEAEKASKDDSSSEISDEGSSRNKEEEEVEIDDSATDKNEKDESEEKEDENKSSEEEIKHVYNQRKLEDVFRDARSSWQGQPSSTTQEIEASETGAFTFGFDLGGPEVSQQPNHTGFGFGFDLPVETTNGDLEPKMADINTSGHFDVNSDTINESQALMEVRRRVGLRFPQDAIESYQADFFACNEGERIIENIDDFRKDYEVKEHWIKERQTLTLDWRSKRKHANSRIQKRMKFR